MSRRSLDHALEDLVTAVIGADDPDLYRRACFALGALMAEHDGEADHSFERR